MLQTEQYIFARIVKTDECWLWSGPRSGRYGAACLGGKVRKAHKVVYEFLKGPVPAGKELDHLCRNRYCVKPEHLEPVSHRENILRGNSPAAVHAKQTHCSRGHSLADAYVYDGGRRRCRVCTLANNRKSTERKYK